MARGQGSKRAATAPLDGGAPIKVQVREKDGVSFLYRRRPHHAPLPTQPQPHRHHAQHNKPGRSRHIKGPQRQKVESKDEREQRKAMDGKQKHKMEEDGKRKKMENTHEHKETARPTQRTRQPNRMDHTTPSSSDPCPETRSQHAVRATPAVNKVHREHASSSEHQPTPVYAAPKSGDVKGEIARDNEDRGAGWILRPHTPAGVAITVCLVVLLCLFVISLCTLIARRWRKRTEALEDRKRLLGLPGHEASGSSSPSGFAALATRPRKALQRLANAARGGEQHRGFRHLPSTPTMRPLAETAWSHGNTNAPLGAIGTVMRTAFGLIEQYPHPTVTASPSPSPSPALSPGFPSLRCAYAGSPNMSSSLNRTFSSMPGQASREGLGLASAAGRSAFMQVPGRANSTKRRSPFDTVDSPILAPSAAFGSPHRPYTHSLSPVAPYPDESSSQHRRPLAPLAAAAGTASPFAQLDVASPRRPSLLRFDSDSSATLVGPEWRAGGSVDMGLVGLGIGMDQAEPRIVRKETELREEAGPTRAFIVSVNQPEDHALNSPLSHISQGNLDFAGPTELQSEREVELEQQEPREGDDRRETLCADTIERGLLWQELPGAGTLRSRGPLDLRVSSPSRPSFDSADMDDTLGDLSASDWPSRISIEDIAPSPQNFAADMEEDEDHALEAISASSSERSLTAYTDGAMVPSAFVRALTEAGLDALSPASASQHSPESAPPTPPPKEAQRSADASFASDDVIFKGGDASYIRRSEISPFAPPPAEISEPHFTPSFNDAIIEMQGRLVRASILSRKRANTVGAVNAAAPVVRVATRARAYSQPKVGAGVRSVSEAAGIRSAEQDACRAASVRSTSWSRSPHRRKQRGSVSTTNSNSARDSLTVPKFSLRSSLKSTRHISKGIAASAKVALACASGSPVSTRSSVSCYTTVTSIASPSLDRQLPETPSRTLSPLPYVDTEAADALCAFFGERAQHESSPTLSSPASTIVQTPSSGGVSRNASISSVASDIAPKALLIDAAPSSCRLPTRAPTLDFHLPLRITPDTGCTPELPPLAPASPVDLSLSAGSLEEISRLDLNDGGPQQSTPARPVTPPLQYGAADSSISSSSPTEVLIDAITLLRSRERFHLPARSIDTTTSMPSGSSADSLSSLQVRAQLLFQTKPQQPSKLASLLDDDEVPSWSDEEAKLERAERTNMCFSPPLLAHGLLRRPASAPSHRQRTESGPATPTPLRSKATVVPKSLISARSRRPATADPAMVATKKETHRPKLSISTARPLQSRPVSPKVRHAQGRFPTRASPALPTETTPTRKPLATVQLQAKVPALVCHPDSKLPVLVRRPESKLPVLARPKEGREVSELKSAMRRSRTNSLANSVSSARVSFEAACLPASPRARRPRLARTRSSTISATGGATISIYDPLFALAQPHVQQQLRVKLRESDYASPTMQVFRFYSLDDESFDLQAEHE